MVARTCRLDLIDSARPGLFDRLVTLRTPALILGGALTVAAVVLAGVRHVDADRAAARELLMSRARATVAERQVAEMLRAGDGGVVLAHLETRDMGRVALTIRPAGVGR